MASLRSTLKSFAPLFGVLVLASACATPIGVTRADPQSVYHHITRNVLSAGEPSAPSEQLLQRRGLYDRFKEDPEATLAQLRGTGSALNPNVLFALAELSFFHAEKEHKQDYYLAAAVYAYAFLVHDERASAVPAADPRVLLAGDLYNLGLSLGLKVSPPESEVDEVVLTDRTLALPFGQLELRADPDTFLWGSYRMSRFIPLIEYKVRGLRNRYRQPGMGAPLAAEVTPVGSGPEAEVERKHFPPRIRVPVTAFVRLENVAQGIAEGRVRGRIELYPADEATAVEVEGRQVPLELEPTATLAYMLEGAPVWATELAGFLKGGRPLFGDGLVMLHPYRPGRIPVVLIHGTASSPARWAEMINEIQNDPALRQRVQLWLFMYGTSNPILLSASQLRQALQNIVKRLDPEGRDPALRRMVLIGHSQGGLLARLMVTESGTRFWDNVFRVPLSELKATPEQRDLLQRTMLFEPLPFVDEVVFIATPHRGSYQVTAVVLDLVRFVVTPAPDVVKDLRDVVRQNPEAVSEAFGGLPTAVDNMRPGHPFIRTLSASPIAPGVAAHSIIAVEGDGPVEQGDDGVVKYSSAHIEGVASEKIVDSDHSCQGNPDTIREVRRILVEHVEAR
ncbi:MAG: esterase/lipase family protein [Candidatus Methylomirabilales bacterium]